ncbi:MAG: hypothetical protein NXI10_10305 [bacterium]|nr:hypothetical protein [bacterium]
MINKLLLLGLSLFFSFTGYTQLVSLEQPELMVLYRGYPNRVFVNISEDADVSVNDIEVQCANCAISKVNKPGGYIVKPGAGKIAYITLYQKEGESLTEIYKAEYRVSNLPDPILYWGGSKSGTKAAPSSRVLLAKYTPEIPLKANFIVTKWTMTANGESISGEGSSLAPAGTIISKAEPGSLVAITAIVVGPDGIARQVGGAWEL